MFSFEHIVGSISCNLGWNKEYGKECTIIQMNYCLFIQKLMCKRYIKTKSILLILWYCITFTYIFYNRISSSKWIFNYVCMLFWKIIAVIVRTIFFLWVICHCSSIRLNDKRFRDSINDLNYKFGFISHSGNGKKVFCKSQVIVKYLISLIKVSSSVWCFIQYQNTFY